MAFTLEGIDPLASAYRASYPCRGREHSSRLSSLPAEEASVEKAAERWPEPALVDKSRRLAERASAVELWWPRRLKLLWLAACITPLTFCPAASARPVSSAFGRVAEQAV